MWENSFNSVLLEPQQLTTLQPNSKAFLADVISSGVLPFNEKIIINLI